MYCVRHYYSTQMIKIALRRLQTQAGVKTVDRLVYEGIYLRQIRRLRRVSLGSTICSFLLMVKYVVNKEVADLFNNNYLFFLKPAAVHMKSDVMPLSMKFC